GARAWADFSPGGGPRPANGHPRGTPMVPRVHRGVAVSTRFRSTASPHCTSDLEGGVAPERTPGVRCLRRSDDDMAHLGLLLLGAATLGLAALTVMLLLTLIHVRRPALVPEEWPGISVLKPLCGADDDLAANIASFAALPYQGDYEVLLGVRSPDDPAWPVAEEAVRRWPGRMRLVRQEREVGLNPKVNQLVGMARAARHD